MSENNNQPREYDVVLGGQNSAPEMGVVLGGIAGVKKRLSSDKPEQRIAALKDAIKYKKPGLAVIIQALQDESELVQRTAYQLLRLHKSPEVRLALKSFNMYRFLTHLRTVKAGEQISLSPDAETVAFIASNKQIKVGEVTSGDLIYSIPKYPKVQQSFIIASDRKTLIRNIKSSRNFVEIWHDEELRHSLYGHEKEIRAIALSPDEQILATGGEDRTIKIWDISTGKLIFNISNLLTWGTHRSGIIHLNFSSDGLLVSSSSDGTIKIWNWQTREKPRTLKRAASSLVISPDGEMLATACWDGKIRILNLETGEVIHTLEGYLYAGNCLAFSPDSNVLASGGSHDTTIKLWNVQTGELFHTLTGHNNAVNCLKFSLDGQNLISGSGDKTVKIWGI